jgi:hypothetical protein
MNRFCFNRLMMASLALLLWLAPVSAAVHPVRIRGSGEGMSNRSDPVHPAFAFSADVSGSPLGKGATMRGSSMVLGPDPAIPGNELVEGEITFESARGDELYATIAGSVNGKTGIISGKLTWRGGTGKFKGARGSASFTADGTEEDVDLTFTFTFTVDGTVNY